MILIYASLIASAVGVIMDPGQPKKTSEESPRTFNEALQSCFLAQGSTLECVNRGALTTLQAWNDDECLDFGDVRLERAEGESRGILDLDWDPKDVGNVLRAASRMLERRNVRWDLGRIYPGLQMRVGPTLTGNGMLEFVMDERSGGHHYHNRQLGTGEFTKNREGKTVSRECPTREAVLMELLMKTSEFPPKFH